MLGLPYPGGPHVAKLAEQGDPARFEFPRPMVRQGGWTSVSPVLKTHTLTTVRPQGRSARYLIKIKLILRALLKRRWSIAVIKCRRALKQENLSRLVMAGGVSANARLRAALESKLGKEGSEVFYPAPKLCTDNGAMIATQGH